MLEIIIIIYAIITLVRGKFSLSGKRELLGWRARVCGGILLLHLPISFAGGVILALTGNAESGWVFGMGFASLITVIIIAQITASILYKGQLAEAAPPPPQV
jgi:hypothetical protein